MENLKQRLDHIYTEQERLTEELEDVVKTYEAADVYQENETLRRDNETYREKLQVLRENYHHLEQENQRLRHALQEQIFDEKMNLLKVSKKKIHTYFGNAEKEERDQLTSMEENAKSEITKLKDRSIHALQKDKQAIDAKLHELSMEVEEAVQKKRRRQAEEEQNALHVFSEQYNQLAEEDVSEGVMQKRMKQNQVEMKIGLSWINKLGILLILLGVAAAFRYSYTTWFNDELKGAMFSVIGLLMLAGGGWFHRKGKQTFALGLLGGGTAVLYGSIFFSYFLLEIIGLSPALLLSLAVTAGTVVLALYYESRTVCTFGLAGGYIPFYSYLFSFGLDETAVYAAMAYFLILNGSVLWISFQKQWSVVHHISFWLNIPSFFILILLSPGSGMSLGYTGLTFLLYLGLTIGYPLTYKTAVKWADVTLLAFNTVVSCTVIYYLFYVLGWENYTGLLAAAFGAVYFGLGRFVENRMNEEKQTMVLFYGTSITFAILMVPFQFGVEWGVLGWLVESVVMMLYASRYRLALLEKAGWVIFGLTLAAFLLEAARYASGGSQPFFHIKYTAVTAGLLIVMFYYIYDQTKMNRTILFPGFTDFIAGVKYVTLVHVWIYAVYESLYWFSQLVPASFEHYWFYQWLVAAFLSVGIGYSLKKTPLLYDKITGCISLFLYAAGGLAAFVVLAAIPALGGDSDTAVDYTALAVLIACQVMIFATGRDLLLAFIRGRYKNPEWYPAVLAAYFIVIQAAFLHVQLQLDGAGFVISMIYLFTAVGYILYGFKRNYVYVRRIGLGLSLFATGKLFFADLAFLGETSEIAAYFCFGLILLGISYLYQKVSSRRNE
ncbi:DUF2339 domain-containing protein [Salibacterium aidingense]|uniref:DUF2339 domain-containing protein n=1 Tax=Salibacterium aidingense TaxID=384933 RepID=UPI003BCFE487